jgi:hypothetical protein
MGDSTPASLDAEPSGRRTQITFSYDSYDVGIDLVRLSHPWNGE